MMDMNLYDFLTNRVVADFHDRKQSRGIQSTCAGQ